MDARDLVHDINNQLMDLEDALSEAQYKIEDAGSNLQKLRQKIEALDDLLYEKQEA